MFDPRDRRNRRRAHAKPLRRLSRKRVVRASSQPVAHYPIVLAALGFVFVVRLADMWIHCTWRLGSEFKTMHLAALDPHGLLGSWSLDRVVAVTSLAFCALLLWQVRLELRSSLPARRKRTAACTLAIVLLAALLFAVYRGGQAAARYDNDQVLDQASMIAAFTSKRPVLEKYAKRFFELASSVNVADESERFSKVHVRDWQTFNRWSASLQLRDITCANDGTSLYFEIARNGIGDRALSQGYAYRMSPPDGLKTTLANPPSADAHRNYVRMEPHWYLFRRRPLPLQ